MVDLKAGGVGGANEVRPEIRRSGVAWLELSGETEWLFSRMYSLGVVANQKLGWNFDLVGPYRAIQIARYTAADLGAFDWHLDLGVDGAGYRKITVAIQIDVAADGGVLQLRTGGRATSIPPDPGTSAVFPTYILHRVTPVLAGERLSVVSWICGPPFR
jgi:PKHD-type hydroxylase